MEKLRSMGKAIGCSVIALMAVTIISCDDDPEPTNRDSVLTGEFEGALFYSDLQEPDTTLKDIIHVTTREVELDGEPGADLLIIAEMDTIFDGNNNPVAATKRLSIKAVDNAGPVSVAVTGTDAARIYGKAQFITFNNTAWLLVTDDPIILASSRQDLTSGQSVVEGEWNGLVKQFMGLLLIRNGLDLMSWVELSVLSFDNYVFHNTATYALD
jgi:hypothetical protein